MNTSCFKPLAAALLLLIISRQTSTLRAQGSLTPPGAPAPTMKSLDQIEARTIVNDANTPGNADALFIISQPGSYYLTTNVAGVFGYNGIEITANNVALDLNGFTVQGAGAYSGIDIPEAQTNVTVRNGIVSGWSFGGVNSDAAATANLVLERLNISACSDGFNIAGACVVRYCNAQSNSSVGIACAYSGLVSDCTANDNHTGGILCGNGTVTGCTADNNGGEGIGVYPGIVSACLVESNGTDGILASGAGCEIIGNTCLGNNTNDNAQAAGILLQSDNNRIEDNHVSASGHAGIEVYPGGYTNNIIVKNSVIGNGTNNYSVPVGNDLGPVGTATNSTSPWANISH